jgi:uncharacterized iron-regulated membrane protein
MANGPTETGEFYQAVWRWHFYAGVLTAPIAIFLAITGATYLWRPQYEDWRYHNLLHVPVVRSAVPASADAQFAAARATHPDAALVSFAPAVAPGRSSETVLVLRGGDSVTVFVDPASAQVLGERRESDRLMMKIHDLHGTLLAGKAGQYVVELAATWMFVLLLTGFYLWWPRPRFSAWGFLLPRLRSGGALFWRDLHAVTAVWGSLGMVFLLTTGMLWTQAGGGWFRDVSAALGQGTPRASLAEAHQSALVGWSPPLRAGLAKAVDGLSSKAPAPAGGSHHHVRGAGVAGLAPGAISLARVVAIAQANRIPADYAILFPSGPTGVFSVVSDRDHPFDRTFLHLDQYSGQVLADVRYRDFGLLGKLGLWAIIAHEGHLFGLLNQVLGTLAALGVILIGFAGLMLWRIRRPPGATRRGLPALPSAIKVGFGLFALVLPLFAASVVLLFLGDRLWFRRLPLLNPKPG